MPMDEDRLVRISKFLSKHLRHQPERLGLSLAPGGWVDVADLLAACSRHDVPLTRELLAEVEEVTKRLGYRMRLENPPAHELRPLDFNTFFFSERH